MSRSATFPHPSCSGRYFLASHIGYSPALVAGLGRVTLVTINQHCSRPRTLSFQPLVKSAISQHGHELLGGTVQVAILADQLFDPKPGNDCYRIFGSYPNYRLEMQIIPQVLQLVLQSSQTLLKTALLLAACARSLQQIDDLVAFPDQGQQPFSGLLPNQSHSFRPRLYTEIKKKKTASFLPLAWQPSARASALIRLVHLIYCAERAKPLPKAATPVAKRRSLFIHKLSSLRDHLP